jgi:hypothetical protein
MVGETDVLLGSSTLKEPFYQDLHSSSHRLLTSFTPQGSPLGNPSFRGSPRRRPQAQASRRLPISTRP